MDFGSVKKVSADAVYTHVREGFPASGSGFEGRKG
jgi:hypothetical protein